MKSFHLMVLLQMALLAVLSPAARADGFNFTYALPLNGVPNGVTAAGTLTTTAFDPVAMDYTIIGITGSRTESGVTETISGLLPPGSLGGNDNLLFPTSPFLDNSGFSYTLASGTGGDDGMGKVNVFYVPGQSAYTEDSGLIDFGTFTISSVAPAPEPAPPMAVILGLAALVGAVRRRRTPRSPDSSLVS